MQQPTNRREELYFVDCLKSWGIFGHILNWVILISFFPFNLETFCNTETDLSYGKGKFRRVQFCTNSLFFFLSYRRLEFFSELSFWAWIVVLYTGGRPLLKLLAAQKTASYCDIDIQCALRNSEPSSDDFWKLMDRTKKTEEDEKKSQKHST